MGQGLVTVSLALIEKAIFHDATKIVEVQPVPDYMPGDDQAVVQFVIDGPGLPQVNDLGLPRPVKAVFTETHRRQGRPPLVSVEFTPTD